MLDQIHWLGNSSFHIDTTPVIYINPWRISAPPAPADVILVGSDKHDSCSVPDIEKLRGPGTRIIACECAAAELAGAEILRPYQTISLGRLSIKGIPVLDARPTGAASAALGFVISINYYDIYYAGDTLVTPDMAALRPDVVILPVDGAVMTAEEAARAVASMRPRWAIPCKWNSVSRVNALRFQEQASAASADSEIVLMQPAV